MNSYGKTIEVGGGPDEAIVLTVQSDGYTVKGSGRLFEFTFFEGSVES